MKVLLLQPPLTRRGYIQRFAMTEPLNGMYLGAHLQPRHEVRLVDLRVTPDLFGELDGFVPDAVVVAAHPWTVGAMPGVIASVSERFPHARVIVNGAADYGAEHIVERPLDFATPDVDVIVPFFLLFMTGKIVPEVLDAWEAGRPLDDIAGLLLPDGAGGWRPTEEREVAWVDGEPLGVPDRTLLGRARGRYMLGGIRDMAYLIRSFGCKFSCRYCTMSKFEGAIVSRPQTELLAELEQMTEQNVFIADFDALQTPDHLLHLADAVEAAGIRKTWHMLTRTDLAVNRRDVLERWKGLGLSWIYLGIDGHSPKRLREIGKGSAAATSEAAVALLKRMGFCVASAITIAPDFTRQDFADVRRAVRRIGASTLDVVVETPLVGTRWFDEVGQQVNTTDWSLYDFAHAVLPTALPLDEFYRELTKLHLYCWSRSSAGMLKSYGVRDILANAMAGPGCMWGSWHAARDHVPAQEPELAIA